jgi:hypothetical protein
LRNDPETSADRRSLFVAAITRASITLGRVPPTL